MNLVNSHRDFQTMRPWSDICLAVSLRQSITHCQLSNFVKVAKPRQRCHPISINKCLHFTQMIMNLRRHCCLYILTSRRQNLLWPPRGTHFCSSQASMVHWLSSSIFPCLSFVRRPAMVTPVQISLLVAPHPQTHTFSESL